MERQGFWEAVIVLLGVGVYAHTVGFGWVYDDEIEVVANVYIRSLASIPQMFTATAWAGAGIETYLYRPLPLVTYALNHALSGLAPWSYHLVNVALHGLASVLVFRLARSFRLTVTAAGAGAILFAVHPVHVEVVASVFGRKDLLAALFTLGMVLSHRSAVLQGGRWQLLLPVLAYGGALLSKEVGAVGVALVLTQDWLLPADEGGAALGPGRRRFGLYLAYALVLLGYLAARFAVAGGFNIPTHVLDNPLVAASLVERVGTALVIVGFGLRLLVVPLPLSPDYSYDAIPLARSVTDPRVLAAVVLLALVAWAMTRRWIRATPWTVFIVWYAVTLAPSSNIPFTIGTVFGERLLYLPSVAFCLALSWSLTIARPRGLALAALAALTAVLTVQAVRYSAAWRDNLTLFRWATESVPRSSKAHHKLGEAYFRAGLPGPAIASLRRATQIAPENEFARETMRVVMEYVESRYTGANLRSLVEADAEVLYTLGQASRARGQMDEAVRLWEAALERDTAHAPSLADLGVFALERADTVRAMTLLTRAATAMPELASPWFNLGRVYLARREHGPARMALQRFVDAAGRSYPDEVAWARSVLDALPSP